jgi:hypothetical protein
MPSDDRPADEIEHHQDEAADTDYLDEEHAQSISTRVASSLKALMTADWAHSLEGSVPLSVTNPSGFTTSQRHASGCSCSTKATLLVTGLQAISSVARENRQKPEIAAASASEGRLA